MRRILIWFGIGLLMLLVGVGAAIGWFGLGLGPPAEAMNEPPCGSTSRSQIKPDRCSLLHRKRFLQFRFARSFAIRSVILRSWFAPKRSSIVILEITLCLIQRVLVKARRPSLILIPATALLQKLKRHLMIFFAPGVGITQTRKLTWSLLAALMS